METTDQEMPQDTIRKLDDHYTGSNLVFVVGSGRSGTTWVQQLLAGHPNVKTGQESHVFERYIGPPLRRWKKQMSALSTREISNGLTCYLFDHEFRKILREYMLKLLAPIAGELKPGNFFVEKTPTHAYWMKEISEMLPDSRFIHVLRDGRDVVASLLAASKTWGYWAPKTPRGAARLWLNNIETVRKDARDLPKGRFLEIRYEELRKSPEKVVKQMFDYIGLTASEPEISTIVKNNSASGGLKEATKIPVSGEYGKLHGPYLKLPDSFVWKAKSGNWKQDLTIVQKIEVWWFIRNAMNREGYAWHYPWD